MGDNLDTMIFAKFHHRNPQRRCQSFNVTLSLHPFYMLPNIFVRE
jgi:hypothetical protein